MGLRAILVLTFITSSIYSKSQSLEFKEGYIINMKGDTLTGQVSIESAATNSQYCNFKLKDQEKVNVYIPKDLIGYGIFNGFTYVKKIILYNESSEELFLQLIVDGIIDLYYVSTDNREFFLIEKENQFYELDNSVYTITKDSKKYLQKSDKYKGVLRYLLNEGSFPSSYFDKVNYNFTDLVKVTKEYHERTCTTYNCKVYDYSDNRVSNKNWKIGYRINIGINHSTINSSNSIPLANNIATIIETNANFEQSDFNLSPSVGVSFQKNLKYSLRIDANYQKIAVPEFSLQRIRIPFSFQREFLGKKSLVPTLAIGFSSEYYFNTKPNNWFIASRLLRGYDNMTPVYEDVTGTLSDAEFNNKLNFRLFASVGVIFKRNQVPKVHVELKTENKSGITYRSNINGIVPINTTLRIANTVLAINYIF